MNLFFSISAIVDKRKFVLSALLIFCGLSFYLPLELYFKPQQIPYLQTSLVILCYAYFCSPIWHGSQRQHPLARADSENTIYIVSASQTGYAEQLAEQTYATLKGSQQAAIHLPIDKLNLKILTSAKKILFVVSTTGEGDAPDHAAQFVSHIMSQELNLKQLQFAILALGDQHYQAYCAFGHRLSHWLHQQHAHCLFDLVEVNNADQAALRHWQRELGQLTGQAHSPDWSTPDYTSWTLAERRLLNPNSVGLSVYLIRLETTQEMNWTAGDIAEVLPQSSLNAINQHREYSIASLPNDTTLDLVVRQVRTPDGQLGLGSGWLSHHAQVGDSIALRIRTNRNFHPLAQARKLLLIGNGTGIAGLRAHLKHAHENSHTGHWLIWGERNRQHDFFFQSEIEHYLNQGTLSRLDLAFSRDQDQVIYVQHKLLEHAKEVRNWVKQGCAIYICGSLHGMAAEVETALEQILGETQLHALRVAGLYRRDVY